ncbi:hypothetical protein Tco_0037422 [Tanacetum coccineum]
MKKLKESVHAIQVGCQIYEGPHLDKEYPLNEEVKQVEEVIYGEFGRTTPFNGNNGGNVHVRPPGYYTKTDNRPPYGEKNYWLSIKRNLLKKVLKWRKKTPMISYLQRNLIQDILRFPAPSVTLTFMLWPI